MSARACLISLACLALSACAVTRPDPQRLPTRAPRAASTVPPAPTPFPFVARQYYEEGLARQRAGDIDAAIQHFSWALRLDPRLTPAHLARGAVYLALGDSEQAISDADAALEVEPSAEAFLLRGEALRLTGRHEAALQAFDQALHHNPDLREDTFDSRWLAARAAEGAARMEELADEYAAAHPDSPLRHYYHGWVAVASGATMDAVTYLVEGIERSSEVPALLWYALGRAYIGESAWSQAVTALETARRLFESGDDTMALHSERPVADLFISLGEAYLGAGRCADAVTMLTYAGSIGAPASTYMPILQDAQACPAPTPTASP